MSLNLLEGKHWYTNGLPGSENNKSLGSSIDVIPDGFYLGRTFGKEFGQKVSSARSTFSDLKKREIADKKRKTELDKFNSLSDEEKEILHNERSEQSRLAYQNMSDEAKAEHARKSSEPHIGTKQSDETKLKISIAHKGKVLSDKHKQDISSTLKSKYLSGELTVWNKGLRGVQHWTLELYEKMYATKTINKSHNTSLPEKDMYKDLCLLYGEVNVIHHYRDSRYVNPKTGRMFECDFYIIPEDRFIELNRFWTHNDHPFNPLSLEDISTLEDWEDKVKNGRPKYAEAIAVWSVMDPLKLQVAKENNLNYDVIY